MIARIRLWIFAGLLVAQAQSALGQWKLIGWNDLGMHCMDGDYSIYAILPPYNNIHAQLIDSSGRLLRNPNGITVRYSAVPDSSASINSTSIWKTNFWKFVQALFGVRLADNVGLAGSSMPGETNQPQPMSFNANWNWFAAEGIPITPFDDAGNKNYYPMLRLTAADAAGATIATADIVAPVSDEMDCRLCHASNSRPDTKPSAGWALNPISGRDYKWNVLRLHDERQRASTTFRSALAAVGYSSQGLAATVTGGTPVLCAKCHGSNALGMNGQPGVPPLTQSIHSFHAAVRDTATGMTLDDQRNRTSCYRCHPGSETRCLRGVMGNAVAGDGSRAIECQSCHGSMSAVGAQRTGWLDQPNCQACHTGSATRNSGQIRYTSVFDDSGQMRQAADKIFATNPDTPSAGVSLYRFSSGHGGLQCEACHGSTHAEFPSSQASDNVQSIARQRYAGTIAECTACHPSMPPTVTGGPHGMHPVGDTWIRSHTSAARDTSGCQMCHGADLRGTVLSAAWTTRNFSVFDGRRTFRGMIVGCWSCHNGPTNDNQNPIAGPAALDASASAVPATPVTIPLRATGGTLRIVSQPGNGTVALSGTTATFTSFPGVEGRDRFTFAAWDGMQDSNLATVTVNVTAQQRPGFTAEGVGNAANYRSGSVAPGELITIFGERMGGDSLAMLDLNTAGLVARSLAGTRVLFDGSPVPLIFTSAKQLAAIASYGIAGKTATQIQVEYQGIRSAPVSVAVTATSPGIFSSDTSGTGQGSILNQDGVTVNSSRAPAPKGSIVAIFATGEGQMNTAVIDGQVSAQPLPKPVAPVSVQIGGQEAEVIWYGAAPDQVAGVLQVNVRIPANVPSGNVPVVLKAGDATSQPGITLAIQ